MKRFKWLSRFYRKKGKTNNMLVQEQAHNQIQEDILYDLKNSRTPLSITFLDIKDPFVSLLLDIDVNRQFLVLDEINSPLGHRLACQGEFFTISASHQGVPLMFHSKVMDHSQINGISFYRLPYPRSMDYMQRRITSRFTVPFDVSLIADFLLPKKPLIRATIVDISLTGIRISIPHNVKGILDSLNKIEFCRILSPFFPAHTFSLEIKFVQYIQGKQKTIVGCQFAQMDNIGLKFLSQLVTRLQPLKR
jgi:c-di-GMP-binding flagellar brake protein YcgR